MMSVSRTCEADSIPWGRAPNGGWLGHVAWGKDLNLMDVFNSFTLQIAAADLLHLPCQFVMIFLRLVDSLLAQGIAKTGGFAFQMYAFKATHSARTALIRYFRQMILQILQKKRWPATAPSWWATGGPAVAMPWPKVAATVRCFRTLRWACRMGHHRRRRCGGSKMWMWSVLKIWGKKHQEFEDVLECLGCFFLERWDFDSASALPNRFRKWSVARLRCQAILEKRHWWTGLLAWTPRLVSGSTVGWQVRSMKLCGLKFPWSQSTHFIFSNFSNFSTWFLKQLEPVWNEKLLMQTEISQRFDTLRSFW